MGEKGPDEVWEGERGKAQRGPRASPGGTKNNGPEEGKGEGQTVCEGEGESGRARASAAAPGAPPARRNQALPRGHRQGRAARHRTCSLIKIPRALWGRAPEVDKTRGPRSRLGITRAAIATAAPHAGRSKPLADAIKTPKEPPGCGRTAASRALPSPEPGPCSLASAPPKPRCCPKGPNGGPTTAARGAERPGASRRIDGLTD